LRAQEDGSKFITSHSLARLVLQNSIDT